VKHRDPLWNTKSQFRKGETAELKGWDKPITAVMANDSPVAAEAPS
jgi:hypothetical protein